MVNVIFMGAKPIGYHCFKYLVDNSKIFNINVLAAFVRDTPAFGDKYNLTKLANSNNILVQNNLNDILNFNNCDIIFSVQYDKILKPEHIKIAKNIAINLHMAPLPEYRGCNQFSHAIINKDKIFGTTLHRLEKGIDSGDILFEKRFKIPKNCFVKNLYDLTETYSVELFRNNLKNIISGNYKLKKQSSYLHNRKTSYHFRHEISKLKKINPNWSAEKIFRYFRATYMPGFPPPYIEIDGNKIYLTLEENLK